MGRKPGRTTARPVCMGSTKRPSAVRTALGQKPNVACKLGNPSPRPSTTHRNRVARPAATASNSPRATWKMPRLPAIHSRPASSANIWEM